MTSPGALWTRLRREARPFGRLASGLAVYLVLRVVFAELVHGEGLLTPSGALDRRLAVFGLVMVVMRITVLVGVPAFVVYRMVSRIASCWLARGERRASRAP